MKLLRVRNSCLLFSVLALSNFFSLFFLVPVAEFFFKIRLRHQRNINTFTVEKFTFKIVVETFMMKDLFEQIYDEADFFSGFFLK